MRGRARALAARVLRENVDAFARLGFREVGGDDFAPVLERGETRLRLSMTGRGRVFGGTYALEVGAAGPVLPATRGLEARGRGVVRLSRVVFAASRSDEAGKRLAARLDADEAVQAALARVHFERLRVEPDGRPVVRQLGGSVVWLAFPPMLRAVPLVAEQAEATVEAIEALARAGR